MVIKPSTSPTDGLYLQKGIRLHRVGSGGFNTPLPSCHINYLCIIAHMEHPDLSEEHETQFLHSRLTGKHAYTFTLGFALGVHVAGVSGVSLDLHILVFSCSNIHIST